MSLIVAKIVSSTICVVSDTKLTGSEYEEIGLKERPADGVVKTVILNTTQCVSFAGNVYYAENAFQEIEQGGNSDDIKEILLRYHLLSDKQTEFIFCFVDSIPRLAVFKGGEVCNSQYAWIGDIKAFNYYQEYYIGSGNLTCNQNKSNILGSEAERPRVSNIRMTVNSGVPNDEFSKMSYTMDHVLYNYTLETVGGFRIQAVYDGKYFSYSRYTCISNEELDIIPGHPGKFGWSNASKGSYYVNCAKGGTNYQYAAIHVLEANLGILYVRRNNGLMWPELMRMDMLDFSDFIAQYNLTILVSDNLRTEKYYNRAKKLFNEGNYRDAIHFLCMAISYTRKNESAHLFYVLGLCFHNYGRILTASLCFEHAIALDPQYEQLWAKQK